MLSSDLRPIDVSGQADRSCRVPVDSGPGRRVVVAITCDSQRKPEDPALYQAWIYGDQSRFGDEVTFGAWVPARVRPTLIDRLSIPARGRT